MGGGELPQALLEHWVIIFREMLHDKCTFCDTEDDVSGWVHTCNFTAHRKALTLQVTDKIRIYELNFHPVPHGVTVSYERYTVGVPVCYGSPSDVLAASSMLLHLYT
jgi:hypothetical protein